MPGYNTNFKLDVDDIELIETALQEREKDLSLKRLGLASESETDPELAQIDATLAETHDLLGRLHNQKVFYRPRKVRGTPYISG